MEIKLLFELIIVLEILEFLFNRYNIFIFLKYIIVKYFFYTYLFFFFLLEYILSYVRLNFVFIL